MEEVVEEGSGGGEDEVGGEGEEEVRHKTELN